MRLWCTPHFLRLRLISHLSANAISMLSLSPTRFLIHPCLFPWHGWQQREVWWLRTVKVIGYMRRNWAFIVVFAGVRMGVISPTGRSTAAVRCEFESLLPFLSPFPFHSLCRAPSLSLSLLFSLCRSHLRPRCGRISHPLPSLWFPLFQGSYHPLPQSQHHQPLRTHWRRLHLLLSSPFLLISFRWVAFCSSHVVVGYPRTSSRELHCDDWLGRQQRQSHFAATQSRAKSKHSLDGGSARRKCHQNILWLWRGLGGLCVDHLLDKLWGYFRIARRRSCEQSTVGWEGERPIFLHIFKWRGWLASRLPHISRWKTPNQFDSWRLWRGPILWNWHVVSSYLFSRLPLWPYPKASLFPPTQSLSITIFPNPIESLEWMFVLLHLAWLPLCTPHSLYAVHSSIPLNRHASKTRFDQNSGIQRQDFVQILQSDVWWECRATNHSSESSLLPPLPLSSLSPLFSSFSFCREDWYHSRWTRDGWVDRDAPKFWFDEEVPTHCLRLWGASCPDGAGSVGFVHSLPHAFGVAWICCCERRWPWDSCSQRSCVEKIYLWKSRDRFVWGSSQRGEITSERISLFGQRPYWCVGVEWRWVDEFKCDLPLSWAISICHRHRLRGQSAVLRHHLPGTFPSLLICVFLTHSRHQERYMGLYQSNLRGYKEGSPITYAHQLKVCFPPLLSLLPLPLTLLQGSLLIIYGTADDNCHFQNCTALVCINLTFIVPFSLIDFCDHFFSLSFIFFMISIFSHILSKGRSLNCTQQNVLHAGLPVTLALPHRGREHPPAPLYIHGQPLAPHTPHLKTCGCLGKDVLPSPHAFWDILSIIE